MWQVKQQNDQVTIQDDSGRTITTLNTTGIDALADAQILAVAPELLEICENDQESTLSDKLRQLARTLDHLACGPIRTPLDQQMRITNELYAWRDYLLDKAKQIETTLQKLNPNPQDL